jgi:DNA polymerase-3 subunit delta'
MPFRDLIGHRPLLDVLARAVARGTLPPSLLFCGPEGVGKRRVALALAQVLNCRDPEPWSRATEAGRGGASGGAGVAGAEPSARGAGGIDACGRCGPCRRIARGLHADVALVAPGASGVIKVDEVRGVIEQAAYRPFEGRRRVVIIDEADRMVDEAQNALLKTLEEPPSSSVFVLVTARPETLRPTVRSRCPRLRFGPLGAADLVAALEARGVSEPAARAVAAAAGGSLGRALALYAGDLAEARETARRVLHLVATTTDVRRRLEGARELAGPEGDRAALAQRLQAMAALLRDVGCLSARAETTLLVNADLAAGLRGLASALGPERTLRAFTAVDRALAALEQRNASPKIVADWLVCRL